MAGLLTRKQSFDAGKKLRKKVPREAHGQFAQKLTRDAVAILSEGDQQRVSALIPERYRRMMASPFAFLRGAAAVMATDLAHHPIAGIPVQASGDCHLMNFGAFATPEDRILFDVNDFDETLPGVDFTVDIKRLAASVAVAALDSGASRKLARLTAASTVAAYRRHIYDLAKLTPLQAWHSRIDLEQEAVSLANKQLRRQLASIISKARGKGLNTDDNFPRLVHGDDVRIFDNPPMVFHPGSEPHSGFNIEVHNLFRQYRTGLSPERRRLFDHYQLTDFAFKAVGVGSVGTITCVGLFMSGDGEPLFLQIKEAQRSVLERLGSKLAYKGHQGRRVVEGQRMMQAATDIFLGHTQDESSGRAFYVRMLKNRRLGTVTDIGEAAALQDYACLCGRTLARAHARSGNPSMISGYLGRGEVFDDALARFAMSYADQNERDHAALVAAKGDSHLSGVPVGRAKAKKS